MTRLALLLAALFLVIVPARAEPPLCKGKDLMADLERRDPAAAAEILKQARAVKNGEAILWKIERDGTAASWLMGTAHVTDPRVTTLPAPAREAFAGASIVALELKEIRSQQEMASASFRFARLMVLPPGQSLWDLVPDADEPLVRNNPNLPQGAERTIFTFQPWVVAAMLSIPACEFERERAGLPPLDQWLAQEAERRGKTLVGLETFEEQLSVFASMPLDLQTRYLLAVAKFGPRTADYFETLISLYGRRLVTAYVPLSLKLEPADDDTGKLMGFVEKDLTVKRNHVMQRRALDLLARGNAFIAVGAMHLPGDEGLVELIRQAGYKVTPVN